MNKEKKTERAQSIPGYLYPLDGIRAISTLLIFFHHLWQQNWIGFGIKTGPNQYLFNLWDWQKFGFIAIDIFFVLSGFCLFYPVAREMFGETKHTSLKTFYLKRARRIWPSYCILLLVMLIFPIFSYGANNTDPSVGNTVWHYSTHVLFIHNFWKDTLGTTISTAWTMPIEVQFYLIFPLVSYFFKKKPMLVFSILFVICQVLRMVVCATPNISYFEQAQTVLYLDVFVWGMLSAYLVVWARNKLKHIDRLAPLMTVISIVCVYVMWQFIQWMSFAEMPGNLQAHVYFRLLYRVILCGATAVLLFSSCYSIKLLQKKILGNKFMVFFSTISYSFYLVHQNINILLKRLNIPYTTADPVTSDRAAMEGYAFLSIVLSIGIAAILTYLVEQPIAKYGYKEYFKRIPKAVGEKAQKLKAVLTNTAEM